MQAGTRTPSPDEITELLWAWSNGDQQALQRLVHRVCKELRRLARRSMAREQRGRMLGATAVVHAAYLGLVDAKQVSWQNRNNFFAPAVQAMQDILVDFCALSPLYEARAQCPTINFTRSSDWVRRGRPRPGGARRC